MDEETRFEDAPESAANGTPIPVKDETTLPKETAVEALPVKTTTTASSNVSSTIQTFTDRALHFLAHSSNETLGACLVGLSASTYFIFGRVGLLVIGVAGGVVLHATWEGVRNDDRDEATKRAERDRRKETGVEVVKRVLDLRSSKKKEEETQEGKMLTSASEKGLNYDSFEPKTAKALNYFTDCVIKDYVYWWYAPQLPGEESFPAQCRRTFVAFILSLSSHLRRKRPADAFLDFVTNASSLIIVFLNELAAATSASPNHGASEAVATYLELKPDSTLAYMLDQEAQDAKLKDTAEDILQAYLDPKAYNCPPVHTFLKEVLAQLVLGVTVTLCSRPEWINEWIVYGLEESETVGEVMDIVDAGVEGRDQPAATSAVVTEKEKDSGREVRERGVEHKRQISAAEEAMDEAMREAKRLTQMMIEEDEKKRRSADGQQQGQQVASSEDLSDAVTTQGAPTPTSSQSDAERYSDETREAQSPITPASERPSTPNATKPFTSFDQIVPSAQPTALSETSTLQPLTTPPASATLTLVNATISIFDDSLPNEKTSIKAKPTIDYLIQIEPSNSSFPGWMIARKYADFENLHEVLRRISVITGVTGFADEHVDLPSWKRNTKSALRGELERYLGDAVKWQPLAESEGMKRFLEKDQGLSKLKESGGNASVNAINKVGGDVFNVLSKAQKQSGKAVLGGSKAVFGGVTSLAGTVGTGVVNMGNSMATGVGAVSGAAAGKRQQSTSNVGAFGRTNTGEGLTHRSQPSTATLDSYTSGSNSAVARQSQDSLRMAGMSTPPRTNTNTKPELGRVVSSSSVASLGSSGVDLKGRSSLELSRGSGTASPTVANGVMSASRESVDEVVRLPPRPSEMPEYYDNGGAGDRSAAIQQGRPSTSIEELTSTPPPQPPRPSKSTPSKADSKPKEPLTDSETSVAVELMFAVITELYTLSSAWNFRRTLLSAAKTYLLRPGNPQLVAIRDLLQTSLLDSNLSDEGIAGHIYKMRENGLPTEVELEAWYRDYPEKNAEQKEELRVKARKLLVTKGMPAALQSVMGAAASGEALGRVFDCLQNERVSRALVFGLLMQGTKVVTD